MLDDLGEHGTPPERVVADGYSKKWNVNSATVYTNTARKSPL